MLKVVTGKDGEHVPSPSADRFIINNVFLSNTTYHSYILNLTQHRFDLDQKQ